MCWNKNREHKQLTIDNNSSQHCVTKKKVNSSLYIGKHSSFAKIDVFITNIHEKNSLHAHKSLLVSK